MQASSFCKGFLDDEVSGFAVAALNESAAHEHRAQFLQHRRTAAQHDAIGFEVEPGKPDVGKELTGLDEVGDAAAVAEGLARHGRIIDELVGDQWTEQLMLAQAL